MGRPVSLPRGRSPGAQPCNRRVGERNLSQREAQLAEHLAKIDHDMRTLDHERRLVKRERETMSEVDARAREREEALHQREETIKQRLNEKLDKHLREARAEIDAIVADLRRQTALLAEQAIRGPAEGGLSTGKTGRVRADARAALDLVAQRARTDEESDAPPEVFTSGRGAAVGDRVSIGGLGIEGTVVLVHDREAEVDVKALGPDYRTARHQNP